MQYQDVIKKVDAYICSEKSSPLLIDVPSIGIHDELYKHYAVGTNRMIWVSDYSSIDALPQMDKLKDSMTRSTDTIFLLGLSVTLMLKGEIEVKRALRSILDLTVGGKLIIVTLGCAAYFKDFDRRLFDKGQINLIDGEAMKLPKLCFIAKHLAPEVHINGLDKLSLLIGKHDTLLNYSDQDDGETYVNVITKHSKKEYPSSLFHIDEYSTEYDCLVGMYEKISDVPMEYGTADQWRKLYEDIQDYDTLEMYISDNISTVSSLSLAMRLFSTYDPYQRWLLFIALLIYGGNQNRYLTQVITKSTSFEEFIKYLFETILDYSPNDVDFWPLYKERKEIISQLTDYTEQLLTYCKQVYGRGENALCYLTDCTKIEKEEIISIISGYKGTPEELQKELSEVYSDLALYLRAYDYHNAYLNEYFKLYKFCKVTNQILPEFISLVEEQATNRQYNEWLSPRSSLIDQLPKDKTTLYFMDAMGVEYIGFMQSKCSNEGLSMKTDIARCELPTITSFNKPQIIQEFKSQQCSIYENSELDKLKHEGSSSYNYENNKLPIHLVEELTIINNLIMQLKTIEKGDIAYVIADHGASRLAVIYEKENKWEVSEKGIHSGRCCPESDIDDKPNEATEENGFWCLANYDRFRGGRKASVEVHGGASLEEVTVPIITITKKDKSIECKLLENGPILVSFRRQAKLTLVVEEDTTQLTIRVNEKQYHGVNQDIKYHYEVEIPDIKAPGIYTFDVYIDGILVADKLTFEVKKEGASEKKLF